MAATPLNRGFITAAVMSAALMQALDTTIANVALPHIQGSVSASQDEIVWVLTFYIVAAGMTMPLTSWLAERFGSRIVFLLSVGGFTVASALCGVAQTLDQIVGFRFLQGVAGAALIPLGQSLLLDVNPPAKHGQALAAYSAAMMLGPIMGPVLGGFFTDNYSWRWCFLINVPVGAVTFVGAWLFLPKKPASRPPKFDVLGFATIAIGIGALQLMCDRGGINDWFGSAETWIEAIVAGLFFYFFVVHTLTAPQPIFSRALFRNRTFNASLVATVVVIGAVNASLALSPPMLQGVYGYPVLSTGLLMAPRGVGMLLMTIVVSRLIGRVDLRVLLGAGLVVMAFSFWMMAGFAPTMDSGPIIVSGFIQGLATTLVWTPITAIAFGAVPAELRSQGTTMWNVVRNSGGSAGISLVQALLTANIQVAHSTIASHMSPDSPQVRQAFQRGTDLRLGPDTAGALNDVINRQAAVIGYLDDFKLLAIALLVMIPLLFVMRRPAGDASHVIVE
ncbi:MAG TPA: DHA2 family efflux MFS transporter permease subunit [Caulobacteraceae bacterium]|jgi:DHA2 family multidrug resistance protein|nr:DHA2 family efflux MFS transporter permease subunit [Caulobacteraceae bacterium]